MQKYVVQVPTERGWLTVTNRASRADAHRLAAKINGRVYNLWTRRPSILAEREDQPEKGPSAQEEREHG